MIAATTVNFLRWPMKVGLELPSAVEHQSSGSGRLSRVVGEGNHHWAAADSTRVARTNYTSPIESDVDDARMTTKLTIIYSRRNGLPYTL